MNKSKSIAATIFLLAFVILICTYVTGCATMSGTIGVLFPDGSRMDIGSDGKQIRTTVRLPVGYGK